MRSKKLLATMILLSACLFSLSQPPAQCLDRKTLAQGGPYISEDTSKIQNFGAELTVPKDYLTMPLWLTFYNGYDSQPGYGWLRAFLAPPGTTGVEGEVLVDERPFHTKGAVTVDVSGKISPDGNRLIIEAGGIKGAMCNWVLTTVLSRLSVIDATQVTPGKSCLIHGTGFSAVPDDNKVLFNGQPGKVVSATDRILEVIPPETLTDKNVSLTVGAFGATSNPLVVGLVARKPHLINMSPYGGPAGGVLNIRGANFSRIANQNVVHIGPYLAPVIKMMDDGTLLCGIPNWGGSGGTLPVTVVTNGVPSDNQLQFWCVPHYYGGDPNAVEYQND